MVIMYTELNDSGWKAGSRLQHYPETLPGGDGRHRRSRLGIEEWAAPPERFVLVRVLVGV
jgi:hypothetical protein